ncbi:hypothetical protein [Halorussus marinus]|uniref:hypothetical protein n=1 Tax=Halorussus marinus TaxID=2505976 RepID=UPI00106DD5CA|nr:hypothetical protein [Halorussus marinus]
MSVEECDHCGEGFDDEETYLRHLESEHGDDLSAIEVRRVAGLDSDEGPSVAAYAGAIGAVVIAGLLAYLLFFSGASGGVPGGADAASAETTPTGIGSAHYHGQIQVEIGGERLDFSRDRFQLRADAFHFENGNGQRWHGHAREVTLGWAMASLGIDVTDESVTYDGTTYRDGEDATVAVEVDGEPVDPESYVLEEGDSIRIVAESGE